MKFQPPVSTSNLFFKKCDFILDTVAVCVNEALKTRSFPDSLTCNANVRPINKKENTFDKRNFRPVSMLPFLSKVYEILCRFRKALNFMAKFVR